MSAIESLLNRLEEKMVSPDEEVRPETVTLYQVHCTEPVGDGPSTIGLWPPCSVSKSVITQSPITQICQIPGHATMNWFTIDQMKSRF